jgi:hypothetical protein
LDGVRSVERGFAGRDNEAAGMVVDAADSVREVKT